MKRSLIFLLLYLVSLSYAISQDILENPEKSSSRNAGRVLELEEVFRIADESGEFYFKSPVQLRLDSEGCFFILDENQILKFSKEGKFLKNLFKKGQGPGEISARFHSELSYFILNDEIYLYERTGKKIIHMNGEGMLIGEIKLAANRFSRMIGFRGVDFLFIKEESVSMGKDLGFYDVDMSVISVSRDGSSSQEIMAFPKKIYTGKNFGMDWAKFFSAYDTETQRLLVSHTSEYSIVLADLNKGEIIRSFNRKYPNRAKYIVPEGLEDFYEKMKPPEKKYEDDVLGLFFDNKQLWVKTSTKHKSKGVLFDVFDDEGLYIDNFYIQVDGELLVVTQDSLFFREKNADETICIVKYDILN
jgi:hypothetical protein